jgi:hypothetical protein
MPITDSEWQSISTMVNQIVRDIAGTKGDYFITGKVFKVDKKNKCIYMKEFGSQPIPIVAFDYEVKYYDESPQGTTVPTGGSGSPYRTLTKIAKATVIMPKKGDTVLVAKEMGTSRLPRCLGVVMGTKWIMKGDE